MLSNQQKQRYLRNILLPEIGEEGQQILLKSKVLVIGAGGLGSAALLYLSAAGIGELGIVDGDYVELSNLQRQVIHNVQNLGKLKAESAKEKILLLNPETKIEIFPVFAYESKLAELSCDYDLIVDACDNFTTRLAIAKVAHRLKKPVIFAAVKGFFGQLSVFESFLPGNPCYCCFNPLIEENLEELPLAQKGIFGGVAGNLGTMQAIAAVKKLLQIPQDFTGKILICDFLSNDFRNVALKQNPDCKICSCR